MKNYNNLKFSSFSGTRSNYKYQLLENGFSKSDILKGIEVLKTQRITMGEKTLTFEKEFAKKLGAKYALMVNSGSSANLLAAFAACNPLRKKKFKPGDEALIPALCWPTSLWPLVQVGLKPKFVDIDRNTLNVSADSFIKKITKKTKVIMLINVLGISGNIEKIIRFAKKKNIIVIEDNCEALGAKLNNKFLGTYGNFGTFSFFYSHQITSGEGGMIVCNEKKDYEILLALRSHGWSRGPNSYKINAKKFPSLDPRYIFINMGFNLRPTEIQASIARNQFSRLDKLRSTRSENRKKIIENITNDKRFNNQFSFIDIPQNIRPSFMGLPIIVNKKFTNIKKKFIYLIEKEGLETRPIISGSFVNQPAVSLFKLNPKKEKFLNAESIQKNGFLIGLHTKKISKNELKFLVNTLFLIDKI
jgi:CDP-4-dehydro-6-deoxyglucose reductase, E1